MQRAKLLSRLWQQQCQLGRKSFLAPSPIALSTIRSVGATPQSAVAAESFLNGTSSVYIEEMYAAWQEDPKNVHKSWDSFFRGVTQGNLPPGQAYVAPPTLVPMGRQAQFGLQPQTTGVAVADEKLITDHLSVQLLIRSFQSRGHSIADLDPLGISSADLDDSISPSLELNTYGLTEKDLDRQFFLPQNTFIGGEAKSLPLREIINRLKSIYCHHIGVEYMHIPKVEEQNWLRERIEAPKAQKLSADEKKTLFKRLIRSTKFEDFLGTKWKSEKRFGLEGCEVLIPAMKRCVDIAADLGVDSFVIGMPHRGRLNVLANVARQPLESIFTQFSSLEQSDEGSGDVKYHLGVSIERQNRHSKKPVRISLVANPSHLEAVDPVVQGKTRAEQFYRGDKTGDKVMSILLHGDAAFSGQGVVYETFHLSELPAYTCHGSIHIVCNNQVGFTTDPRSSRSSPYCTDVARVTGSPIFHVNADDAEAVMHVCQVATEFRQRFKRDVVIDLVCYRRHGHNELDEPAFTQPLMYQRIGQTEPVLVRYKNQLISEGIATDQYVKEEMDKYGRILEESYKNAQKENFVRNRDWLDSPWDDFFKTQDPLRIPDTGVDEPILRHIAEKFSAVPEEITIHPKLKRTLAQRQEMMKVGEFDWAYGEAFAFGSLLGEGQHVRLSGQDVERGTFSHRHHVLHDQKVDKKTFTPLNHLWPGKQGEYLVCNSSLSEYAVLGFELGWSMVNPNSPVMWEAQFGDFSNTAQCIIDQFISSGQSKWIRQTGLTLLLPHGMEGMGPEHSSARPERFLQMSNDDEDYIIPEGPTFEAQQLYDSNWIVANCTTPANFFHLIRRQVIMPFRKPLIVMTPKSPLRLPEAKSKWADFAEGTRFRRLIPDETVVDRDNQMVDNLVFCSGKIYYELVKARHLAKMDDKVVVARIEQVSPFPYDLVKAELLKFPNAKVTWVQEEHKNMGAYQYAKPRLIATLKKCHIDKEITYVGRETSSSPATGNKHQHYKESRQILTEIFGADLPDAH